MYERAVVAVTCLSTPSATGSSSSFATGTGVSNEIVSRGLLFSFSRRIIKNILKTLRKNENQTETICFISNN